jgi:hypothetical protein
LRIAFSLQLVEIGIQSWDSFLQALAFARIGDDLARLCCCLEWISGKNLPMVEDALRESLSTSITTQVSGETYCQNK